MSKYFSVIVVAILIVTSLGISGCLPVDNQSNTGNTEQSTNTNATSGNNTGAQANAENVPTSTETPKTKGENHRIAFYNVENLFDTKDDLDKYDNDYLPSGKLSWTNDKYQQKLTKLSKVIDALKSDDSPEIIGLCEVENRKVVEDLIQKSGLQNYGIVHKESPDERGIDVAMIYDKTEVKILEKDFLKVKLPRGDKTREILYAKVEMNGAELHVFFNHWPSKGSDLEGRLRTIAANTLRKKVDALMKQDENANILIMGDMNEEPHEVSMQKALRAKTPNRIKPKELYNLSSLWAQTREGTHFYDEWNVIDQIIVSTPLMLTKNNLTTQVNQAKILKKDWMLFFDRNVDNHRPSKFMSGKDGKVYGGYSDHLPVYLDLQTH